jgi:predicted nucleic acid-binding protein
LAFLGQSSRLPSKLLYDTTVYIDILQGTFPRDGEIALRTADAWHSTVTAAELCAPIGSLNPAHPGTGEVVRQLTAAIERRPVHRTIAPDREIWLEAGLLTGVLARLQQCLRSPPGAERCTPVLDGQKTRPDGAYAQRA